jgi:sorting nexin-29
VSGNNQSPTFFHFADRLQTSHEKERFRNLRHIWTESGKSRALLRASLNERSLERYLLIWISDENLADYYENWALLRTFGSVLIELAQKLNGILFAVTVDCPELNIPIKIEEKKNEPIIQSQPPIRLVKKVNPTRAIILDDNDDEITIESDYGVSPKPLSSLCLKQEKNTGVSPVLERIIIDHQRPPINDFRIQDPTSVHSETINYHSEKDLDSNSNIQFDIDITSPESGVAEEDTSEVQATIVTNSDISSSSIPSSINSEKSNNPNDLQRLRERLREQELRNQELEERVNQLTIENHRLRMISAHQRVGTFFTISISRAVQLRNQTSSHYAYEIHIIPTVGDEWTVSDKYTYKVECLKCITTPKVYNRLEVL